MIYLCQLLRLKSLKKTTDDPRQGSILIIVLLLLAASSLLILEAQKRLRTDYASAAVQKTQVVGSALLRSGLALAKDELLESQKENDGDHLFDDWAQFDKRLKNVSSQLESGTLRGTIACEDGKVSLNALNRSDDQGKAIQAIFLRLVDGLRKAHKIDGDPKDYLKSIKIWMGAKDTQGDKSWYASREPRYLFPKTKFRVPNELLLVRWRGVSREEREALYWGDDSIPGLRDFVTVWGGGKINMNTAPEEIIAATVAQGDLRDIYVTAVQEYRSKGENIFLRDWYKEIALRVGLDLKKFPEEALTSKGTAFRVKLEASVGAGSLHSVSIVERQPKGIDILYHQFY